LNSPSLQDLATVQVRLPQHVVHRAFVEETVVLNLRTGKYHGLNPTAGRMLERLIEAASIAVAVDVLADEYERERTEIEGDVVRFCEELLERELIEVVQGESA
jgi:Coenzyme PQQ synthesis protein D (PqqD)